MKRELTIFISYTKLDSDEFNIKELAQLLGTYSKIGQVIYYEKEKYINIVDFMNKSIEKCDLMVSICSFNANQSKYVDK